MERSPAPCQHKRATAAQNAWLSGLPNAVSHRSHRNLDKTEVQKFGVCSHINIYIRKKELLISAIPCTPWKALIYFHGSWGVLNTESKDRRHNYEGSAGWHHGIQLD